MKIGLIGLLLFLVIPVSASAVGLFNSMESDASSGAVAAEEGVSSTTYDPVEPPRADSVPLLNYPDEEEVAKMEQQPGEDLASYLERQKAEYQQAEADLQRSLADAKAKMQQLR